mgnify:CR=1 FL=1
MFFGDEDTAPVPMEGQSIVEFDYDPKERAKEIAGGEPGPVYYDESTGELRVEPPGPPPPPEVAGAVQALNVVKSLLDASGKDVVDKDVLDAAIQQIQEQGQQGGQQVA